MATIIKGSTKRGQRLIENGTRWEGNWLHQVYDRWSSAKEKAFDDCYDKYLATPEHSSWGICSYNTFSFSVSWLGVYNDENALFIETSQNSYVVLLDK